MNRSHVTLPQILVAASARHANMVAESAAYLVLALCDAIGCLPLIIPDVAIELSADGTVALSQQGKVAPAPEASQAMRDLFTRLLAVTQGATPRLAAVARPRELSAERGVDAFAAEVEAALVPMNRAAGKRSLGRLARETLRAIESGTLALHLQARAAAKEAPAAATAAVAPLMVAPAAIIPKPIPQPIALPLGPLTPPPSLLSPASESYPFDIPVTPTTPGLGLETIATEAHVDSSVFGATPTYREGDKIAVEPVAARNVEAAPAAIATEGIEFESTNTAAVSCEPTQLSARDVQIDPALRAPKSDPEAKAVSTKRRDRRSETPQNPQEITLASAGVEPIADARIETPAPSSPEEVRPFALDVLSPNFGDCHDGHTQSAPKYHETLLGLAPVTPPVSSDSADASSGEPLQSSEYLLVTPSALPQAVFVPQGDQPGARVDDDAHDVFSAQHLITERSATIATEHAAPLAAEAAAEAAKEVVAETASAAIAQMTNETTEPPQGFQALDVPSDEPGRVDELLGTFGRPEEGEEEMLRRTASSLKELAGLDPTPCAPSVSPAIRVPLMSKRATPAWLPEDPRNAPILEPAPLVPNASTWRAKLALPLALFIALAAGFAVVHWRLPEVVLRWVRPVAAKQSPAPRPQAAADQDVYDEP